MMGVGSRLGMKEKAPDRLCIASFLLHSESCDTRLEHAGISVKEPGKRVQKLSCYSIMKASLNQTEERRAFGAARAGRAAAERKKFFWRRGAFVVL
jgi:hypothetical protein